MTAIHTGGSNPFDGTDEVFREKLRIHDDCIRLGRFAVIVRASDFAFRMRAAIKRLGYKFNSNLVSYYDAGVFHGNFSFDEIPFRKSNVFSFQKEYRFVVDTGIIGGGPKIIDIGDVSNIAVKIDARAINDDIILKAIRT